MSNTRFFIALIIAAVLLYTTGCAPRGVYVPPYEEPKPTRLIDDMDASSLREAIDRSIQYYRKKGLEKKYCFRDRCYKGREMVAALEKLKSLEWTNEDDLRQIFEPVDGSRNLTVTGYFEPVLKGSPVKDDRYRYPIYRPPQDMIFVKLGKFNPRFGNETLIGRLVKNEVVPYYVRKEIDGQNVLEKQGLEIAWVDDPVELFFLHIQGSGKIQFPDGSLIQVSYAQRNGRPYRSVVTHMVEKGYLKPSETSHRKVKEFLKNNPALREEIMSYNENYIFFQVVKEGPVGALGVPLVAGRSVALDADVYPPGVPVLLSSRRPVKFEDGVPVRWENFSRIVFNHDGGTAIKGPHRLDLFCGTGPEKELEAGSLKEEGRLYLLLPRP